MADQNANVVVSLIDQLTKVNRNNPPCKKTVQKIVYLIEEAGGNLGFDYSIHFYGPYSSELDYEIQNMNAKGFLKISYTEHGHLISASTKPHKISLDQISQRVVEHYGIQKPSDLELLATALFVQREINALKLDDIVAGVKKIKGSKYSEKQIHSAIYDLVEQGYFKI